MQQRTLDNLLLNGEDYTFEGSLTIYGEVNLVNCSLIVNGRLLIHDDVKITGGNIIATHLFIEGNVSIDDGDIIVHGNLDASNITSNRNIEVDGDSDVKQVTCLNYLISRDNNSHSITAIQDIYILGDCDCYNLKGREIFIDGNLYFNKHSLSAKTFCCNGKIQDCFSLSVG